MEAGVEKVVRKGVGRDRRVSREEKGEVREVLGEES